MVQGFGHISQVESVYKPKDRRSQLRIVTLEMMSYALATIQHRTVEKRVT